MVLSSKYDISDTHYYNHSHADCEIIYAKRGSAQFTFFDKQCVLKEKQLILITALEDHAVSILTSPYERYLLQISGEDLKKELQEPELFSVFFTHVKNAYFIFDFYEQYAGMETLLQHIYDEYQTKSKYYEETIRALLQLLVISMYRNKPVNFQQKQPLTGSMFQVQRYIEANYRREISLGELAGQIFVSPGYLSHAFKKYSGYSPKKYITMKRLNESKRLLLTTDFSVKNISKDAGFADVNNFIRCFKEQFGVTPHRFRNKALTER